MVELRRRKYRREEEAPVAYPAWRIWEDRRVRADDAASAVLFGVRIARVGLEERAARHEQGTLVSDLYSDEELPFRGSFRVTLGEAEERWSSGEQELCSLAVLQGVAALDDLLAGTIELLRAIDRDVTRSGLVDTGVSAKLRHLTQHGHLAITDGTLGLHDLSLAMRNAITHDARRQQKVIAAWGRLDEADQDWWTDSASRPLPLAQPEDELVLDDRELVAAFKTFDRVALEVNHQLRDTLDLIDWARMVAREFWVVNPTRAGDPTKNVRGVCGWAFRHWRLTLPSDAIATALKERGLRHDSSLGSVLREPNPM